MNIYLEALKKILFDISPKIITALIILFVGLWVTSIVTKAFKKIMLSRNIELTLTNFLGNLIFVLLPNCIGAHMCSVPTCAGR